MVLNILFILLLIIFPGGGYALAYNRTIARGVNYSSTIDVIRNGFLNWIFGSLSIVFISSVIKSVTGKGLLTVFESLQNISRSTFRHYLLIDLVVLFLVYVVALVLKHEKWMCFCEKSVSIFAIEYVISVLFFGRFLSNRLFAAEYSISVLVSFVFFILTKGKINSEKTEMRQQIKIILPGMIFWTVVNYIYIPGELFLSNISEIRLRYYYFLLSCVIVGIATTLMVYIISILMSEKMLEILSVGIFAITLCSYFQHMFLNGKIANLDGTYQQWSTSTKVWNVVIWLGIIVIIYAIYTCKSGIYRIFNVVALGISAMLVLTVCFLALTTKHSSSDTLTCEGALELSKRNNVIVFVLDWYDTQFVDKIMAEDSDFFEELNDFTYYDNVTSLYPYTGFSVPYLLTGTKWEPGVDTENNGFVDYAFLKSSFLRDVNQNGYSVGVYTEPTMVADNQNQYVMNYSQSPKQAYNIMDNAKLALRTSKYLGTPFLYKNRYAFNTYDYMNLLQNDDGWVSNDDKVFYNDLINKGLSLTDSEGAFRFYHMYGVHSPFNTTENLDSFADENVNVDVTMSVSQAKGAMKIVYEYLHQLQELDLYNDATIIITADHGQNYIFKDNYEELLFQADLDKPSSPILFIKMPGEKTKDGRIQHNSLPVSHEYARNIISEELGVSGEKEVSDNDKRTITDIYSANSWKEYFILGNVHDWNNWSCEVHEGE